MSLYFLNHLSYAINIVDIFAASLTYFNFVTESFWLDPTVFRYLRKWVKSPYNALCNPLIRHLQNLLEYFSKLSKWTAVSRFKTLGVFFTICQN